MLLCEHLQTNISTFNEIAIKSSYKIEVRITHQWTCGSASSGFVLWHLSMCGKLSSVMLWTSSLLPYCQFPTYRESRQFLLEFRLFKFTSHIQLLLHCTIRPFPLRARIRWYYGSADSSHFVVTMATIFGSPHVRPLQLRMNSYHLYPPDLHMDVSRSNWTLIPCAISSHPSALYQISVSRAKCLPRTSFRFRLATDTLIFGCNLPTTRAVWGLSPIRIHPCWTNTKNAL